MKYRVNESSEMDNYISSELQRIFVIWTKGIGSLSAERQFPLRGAKEVSPRSENAFALFSNENVQL